MAVVRRNRVTEALWAAHVWLFERSGGRLGTRIGGMPVLRLTTRGRRSGRPRSVTLMYLDVEGTPLVVGSNAGEPRDPAWLLNLRADPNAEVMTRAGTRPVRARELDGPERERLWERLLEVNSDYSVYERRAGGRTIPLVLLEREAGR